jgi:hypothetical protein
MKLLIMQFPPISRHFISLRSEYSPNKYIKLSSLSEQTVRDAQLLHPEKSRTDPTLFLAAMPPGGQRALKV